MAEQKEIVRDFDNLDRPKRIGIIGGERVDLTKLPSIISIKMSKLKREELAGNPESFEELLDILIIACRTNRKVTKDWLLENTDMEQLLDFLDFILEPLTARTEAKKAEALELEKEKEKETAQKISQ